MKTVNNVRLINSMYLIRLYNVAESNVCLVGAGQLEHKIGIDWTNKLFNDVLDKKWDKHTYKIRSRFVVVFVPK